MKRHITTALQTKEAVKQLLSSFIKKQTRPSKWQISTTGTKVLLHQVSTPYTHSQESCTAGAHLRLPYGISQEKGEYNENNISLILL